MVMARCDEGYRCEVCGRDVERITDSDLYLRYILGEVSLDQLHRSLERHIACNPALAQWIADESFPSITLDGPFDRRLFPAEFRMEEVRRITEAWRRLQAIPTLGLSIVDYPIR